MWYVIVYGAVALWVLLDARSRQAQAMPWAVGTGLLGPIVLPVYLAIRPLKAGEVREGGTGWNILRNFALLWTILIAVIGLWSTFSVSGSRTSLDSGAGQAGAALGTALALGFLVALWFFPLVGALALGLFLKKASVIERGPTGPLALSDRPTAKRQVHSAVIVVAILTLTFLAAVELNRDSDESFLDALDKIVRGLQLILADMIT